MTDDPRVAFAEHQLQDVGNRVRFQHEFALAGFRTLVLINGGAIIALLTYMGNVAEKHAAHALGSAFIWYVVGLSSTTIAYVFAYYSQGMFLTVSIVEAQIWLGVTADPDADNAKSKKALKRGKWCIYAAVVATILGLASFVAGSSCAMAGLT